MRYTLGFFFLLLLVLSCNENRLSDCNEAKIYLEHSIIGDSVDLSSLRDIGQIDENFCQYLEIGLQCDSVYTHFLINILFLKIYESDLRCCEMGRNIEVRGGLDKLEKLTNVNCQHYYFFELNNIDKQDFITSQIADTRMRLDSNWVRKKEIGMYLDSLSNLRDSISLVKR